MTVTYWHDEDIGWMLEGTGAVPFMLDNMPGIGHRNTPDELAAGDPLRASVILGVPDLIVQTSQFPNVHVDSMVVIEGETYTVLEHLREGDGALTRLKLGTALDYVPPAPPTNIDGGFFDGTDGSGGSPDGGPFEDLTFALLGTDDFSPDANPLDPAMWTPVEPSTFIIQPLQAAGGECRMTVAPALNGELFTGATIGPDQWVSVDLAAWSGSVDNEFDIGLRTDPQAELGAYLSVFTLTDATAFEIWVQTYTGDPSNPEVGIQFHQLYTPALGDTLLLAVKGNTVYAALNGINIFTGSDPALPSSGVPSIYLYADAETDVAVTNFKAGEVS